jgi:hypothetical protein
VLAATLPAQSSFVRHAIDYVGAGLLADSLAALILVTDLGGVVYAWASPLMIGLIVVGVVGLIMFTFVERRAEEPILPLRLFRIRDVWVTSAVGLIIGFALLGSVTYLPLFLQIVKGLSPTASGLWMIPLMGGTLTMSIFAGQIVSRTGRYKLFPIIGTAMVTIALFLISRMTAETTMITTASFMLLLGCGLGCVMQVLIIAVQNAVDYHDLGVATSNAILFRFIGGSLGTALLGAVLATQLNETKSLIGSLDTVFTFAAAVAFFGFSTLVVFAGEAIERNACRSHGSRHRRRYRTGVRNAAGLGFARAVTAWTLCTRRSGRAASLRRGDCRTGGCRFESRSSVLLVQIEREPEVNIHELGRKGKADPIKLQGSKAELLDKSLVAASSATDVIDSPKPAAKSTIV